MSNKSTALAGQKSIGKRVFEDLYVHLDALDHPSLASYVPAITAAQALIPPGAGFAPNVAKVNLRTGRLSLLAYPEFNESPFPELAASWAFQGGNDAGPVLRTYASSLNPPILHRKELLVKPEHPRRAQWMSLTETAEGLGLFDDSAAIGFRINWLRQIESKGFRLVDSDFVPIGNEMATGPTLEIDAVHDLASHLPGAPSIQRHLTALSRNNLSAPVQLLLRNELLHPGQSFFDYGCGRGGDMCTLAAEGFEATGWDPYFANQNAVATADVVNLGFVLNVIEDPAERVEALHQAFKLARRVLAVSVMLYSNDIAGLPFGDGVITSRKTFQKYFAQSELKEYIEQALNQPAFMAGPGIALVFADKELEQRFNAGRYRRPDLTARLLAARRIVGPRLPKKLQPVLIEGPPRSTRKQEKLSLAKPHLDALWELALDLGRWPDADEFDALSALEAELGTMATAKRMVTALYDMTQLAEAASARTDDLLLYLATQQFTKRKAYRHLEPRLQRDVKAFFGDYRAAETAALKMLVDSADPTKLFSACKLAAEQGLGWLEDQHSLQLHVALVNRLPAVLRAYVACGLVMWDAISEVQLVKIHIGSGKLSLMEFVADEFDTSPLPRLKRRIKVNLRKQDYDVFEYGSADFPMPLLYRKSRFMHEETPGYADQLAFDTALESSGLLGDAEHGPAAATLAAALEHKRLMVQGMTLMRSQSIPDLDQTCGNSFTFRDFIECGETQQRLAMRNIPLRPETYNALYDLATKVLDPVIDYFGAIRLTYGFCSAELGKHIHLRVALKLDQHASWETNRAGKLICDRGGAACDFIIEDEDMRTVADWIIANLPFDRLYFYGKDRPIHISSGPEHARAAVAMRPTGRGRLMPTRYM